MDERSPAAAPGVDAWAQSRGRSSEAYDAWIRVDGRHAVQVNAAGTEGFPGGFDGRRLVYQQIHDSGTGPDSDLWTYDVVTRARTRLGSRVNTDEWEWGASMSGRWLLFGRGTVQGVFDPGVRAVLLLDRATGEARRLAVTETLDVEVYPGQVAGGIAVWSVCRQRKGRALCDVYRHDIAGRTTGRLPRGDAVSQFAPSVTAAGVVYAVRSDGRCGAGARLVRLLPGAAAEIVTRFAGGAEPSRTVAFEDVAAGGAWIYFDRVRCATRRSDVLRVFDSG